MTSPLNDDLNNRLRMVEIAQSTHEGICAERYRGINVRLNFLIYLMMGIIVAAAAGNRVISFLVSFLK